MSQSSTKICHICKQDMLPRVISKVFKTKSGKSLKIMSIPTYVCPSCGEIVYTKETIEELDKLLHNEE